MEAGDEGIEIVDSKDLQQQSKAFDKLTDHVEDRQLDSSRVQTVSYLSSYTIIHIFKPFIYLFVIFVCEF